MELHIDEEFKSLLPDLSDSERKELEKQILRDGVLNPIIAWNGSIVDGHNRYMICKLNGINEFPVKEMKFESREDVIEWILRHQLGRRNLTDFQRTRIALRYEEMIAKKAKERQRDAGGDRKSDEYKKNASVPRNITDTHTTRDEIAKIAGTSGSTVMRTKYILENGTEEQIARAERGGVEPDGKKNSIRSIEREIKAEKEMIDDVKNVVDNGNIPDGTKKCSFCGEILPLDMFYKGRTQCKKCHDTPAINKIGTPASKTALSAPVEDLMKDLYGTEKDMEYTSEDLLSDLETNGNMMLDNLQTIISIHKDMIENNDLKHRVSDYFEQLSEKIKKLLEVEDGN